MIMFTSLWSMNLLITSSQKRMKDRNQGRETEQICGANNMCCMYLYMKHSIVSDHLYFVMLQGWLLEKWMCSWIHKWNCYYFLKKTICPWVSKLSYIMFSSLFLLLRDNCQYVNIWQLVEYFFSFYSIAATCQKQILNALKKNV